MQELNMMEVEEVSGGIFLAVWIAMNAGGNFANRHPDGRKQPNEF
jgi:hypothetical protein